MDSINFCLCGCGNKVKPGRSFVHGHNGRGRSISEQERVRASAAKVGENNPMFGKKHSAKWIERQRLMMLGNKFGCINRNRIKINRAVKETGVVQAEYLLRKAMSEEIKARAKELALSSKIKQCLFCRNDTENLKFCSKQCYWAYRSGKHIEELYGAERAVKTKEKQSKSHAGQKRNENTKKRMRLSNWKHKNKIHRESILCLNCGKIIVEPRKNQKFCNNKCCGLWNKGRPGKKWTEIQKRNASIVRSGETWEDRLGREKSDLLKIERGRRWKGKTYEEIYGVEGAKVVREKVAKNTSKHKRGVALSETHRKNIAIAGTGRTYGKKARDSMSKGSKKRYENKEYYDKIVNHLAHIGGKKPTKIENILFDKLQKEYPKDKIERQYCVGKFIADCAIPERKLAFEADGEYWHRFSRHRDNRRDVAFLFQGWSTKRFTERQLLNFDISEKKKEEILRILDKHNINGKLRGSEYIANCPFHEDEHPSFSINIETGLWNCFSEGVGGNIKSFLNKLGDANFSLAILKSEKIEKEVALFFNEQVDSEIAEDIEQEEKQVPFISTEYPQWILDRGFTKEILLDWNCVVNNDTQSLIIPIKNQYNKCIGWVARKAPEGKPPKYLYSSGTQISHVLFGLWQYRFPIPFLCLVEGPLDAIWLDHHKFPAVALGGAHLSKTQENILVSLPVSEVVLCFDNDKAGRIVDNDVKKRLNKYFVLSRIEFDAAANYKDVQDIRDSGILKSILESRKLAL